ncbi:MULTISPECIES: thiamine phosphate synthase [Brevibacillus]|uniref:Thiamine-phosphate synthase n=1 Tax=Brevibacillus invocatus TaxID=173959 RepID=A0A3M8CCC2_9BACL|nr:MULTISPECIES: thiamine phosphate synthase [Brevibacillus]MDH4618494.1 thiamine phosphate synthase [Brevibacillus sp. AY1]RNB73308.1 thiamine phosphate synthase [Brevibacillus invocatus]
MLHRSPELHVISSGRQSLDELLRLAESAFAGGMNFFHIREKQRTARECMDLVLALVQTIPGSCLIVNDRVDVAAAAHCRGAHLAYHSLSPQEARMVLYEDQWVGRSVHSYAEAQEAHTQGVDYMLYGHVYASGSKPGIQPRGTEELQRITSTIQVPVMAIGGITPENTAEVLRAGCAGIAVMSGITAADDVKKATQAYRQALDRWEENKA